MTAYYNEIDKYCCQWLRNLMAAGLIPPGDVDDRPIQEVQPQDVAGYTQCHFFAGLGGWAYAARLAGWPDERPIWTGSCPCQPFSVAGRRKGVKDERHLWPDFYRLIRGSRPPVVLGEQVAGAAGYAWLAGVLTDLEKEGYSGRAVDIPACSVNAPHIRSRIYWLADAEATERWGPSHAHDGGWRIAKIGGSGGSDCRLGDAQCAERRPDAENRIADNDGAGAGWREAAGGFGLASEADYGLADSDIARLEGWQSQRSDAREERAPIERSGDATGGLEYANESFASNGQIQRGGQFGWTGGDSQAGAGFWDDWELVGPDPAGKYRRVKRGVRLLASGVPARISKLRALGNAIVPQLAAEVIRAYMEVS